MDALDAEAAQLRRPQEVPQIPRRLGEVLVGEAAARFEYADPIALLGEPQRGDAAAEPRTDDEDVVVRLHHTSMGYPMGNQPEPMGREQSRTMDAVGRALLRVWYGVYTDHRRRARPVLGPRPVLRRRGCRVPGTAAAVYGFGVEN
jgi:hypothetical protein